jgi:Kef-type K+ transport system membrane component KefB
MLKVRSIRLIIILSVIAVFLLIPLVAMQFTSEVDWNTMDFIIMGILLLSTGLGCELLLRKVKSTRNRIILCGLVLLAFFLIWAELAVGLFGTPFAGS